MSSNFREQLEAWLKTIDVAAEAVIDIGGSQLPVKDRVKSWQVEKYTILDLPEPHKTEIEPHFYADIERAESIPDEVYKDYGVAFCLEVAEYLTRPFDALMNIRYMLRPGGLLYISFPFIYPHHDPVGKDCLRYTRWGIEKLMYDAGFEILENKARIATENGDISLQNFFSHEGMRRSKTYAGHDEIGYLVTAQKRHV